MPRNSLCFGSPVEVSDLKGSVAFSYALSNQRADALVVREGREEKARHLLVEFGLF